ncbi:alpha/beta hydrolase [Pseudonocardia sp.]|uniref:alpha/beta hydrolase n=1 Tax=Pseudonocardia sp. TaxID=60912 RepID=UPI003D117750
MPKPVGGTGGGVGGDPGSVLSAAVSAVVLPGSGSDGDFVRRAFAGPLHAVGIRLVAPAPRPGHEVVVGYRAALDAAAARATARGEALLVGGVSLGALVAARWAAQRVGAASDHREGSGWSGATGPVAGLLLALPAWTGEPGDAPAALAARATAAQVRASGLDGAISVARAGAPAWLADELARAWSGHGTGLADALDVAAAEPGPDGTELARIGVPAGVVAAADDPVHPLAVAETWCGQLPRARLVTTRLAAVGADPAVLGRAAVLGWLRARSACPPGLPSGGRTVDPTPVPAG